MSHSNNIDYDPKSVLLTLIRSYARSNRAFPQTRFYFVIDFSAALRADLLKKLILEGLHIPSKTLERLSTMAAREHNARAIQNQPTPATIWHDVEKMLLAQKEVFERYCVGAGNDPTNLNSFISDCAELKAAIDNLALSHQYLEYLAPATAKLNPTHWKISKESAPLAELICTKLSHSRLLVALRPELVRPVWALRLADGTSVTKTSLP